MNTQVCDETIANSLIKTFKEVLNAEVDCYTCYDSDRPTHRYKKIVIKYGKEEN